MEIIDRFTNLNLGRVRYSITGESSKNLVVLMHGLTTPKEVFDDLTQELVSKKFQVLAFDFYGRGLSDHIQPIESEKIYADQAIELIRKFIPFQSDRKIHLLGYSAGGVIASMVAVEIEEHVSSLILVASTGLPYSPSSPALFDMLEKVYSNGEINEKLKKSIEELIFSEFQLIKNQLTREKLIKLIVERGFWDHDTIQTVRGHLKATGGYIGDSSITHIFKEIGSLNIPTFILNGEKDNWIDPECGREINKLISSSKIKEFEGASHWAFLEQPNEYTHEIINFLVSA